MTSEGEPAGSPPETPVTRRRARPRVPWWMTSAATVALLVGLVVLALEKVDLQGVGHALSHVSVGWVVLACVLMGAAFVARGESWFVVIRAALPEERVGRVPVIRALFVGMAGSTVAPGRLGEAARVLVIARHTAERAGTIAALTGTVLVQTLLNLVALATLAAVALGAGAIPGARSGGILAGIAVPILALLLAIAVSQVVSRTARSTRPTPRFLVWIARQIAQGRQALRVFRDPGQAVHASAAQFAGWALQWSCCAAVLLAFDVRHHAAVAAAAVLLAVNLTAILPLTPSNVGVFQAACIAVLAVFGVPSGRALAYGLVLQAIEITMALSLGLPSLLLEGISVGHLRRLGRPDERPPGGSR